MRDAGYMKYYTEAEAKALSGLDRQTIAFLTSEGVVHPERHGQEIEYSQNDVLLMKLVFTLMVSKRAMRANRTLRAKAGLPARSAPETLVKNPRVQSLIALIDQLQNSQDRQSQRHRT